MERKDFVAALEKQLEPNIVRHSFAVEACMGGLYDYLQSQGRITDTEPSKEDWMLAGLIHDCDFGGEYKAEHPQHTRDMLAKYCLEISDTVLNIVKAHAPELTGYKAQNLAEWSIFCVDSLTGLITAVAYVYPSRKIADVKVSSVLKRFLKEPKFAAGTRRDEVAMCANEDALNIPIEKFVEISLTAMQGISDKLLL
ncbi:HD domain-containing protein [bacterium]|nr:HD domain-containing protein [bacterium]